MLFKRIKRCWMNILGNKKFALKSYKRNRRKDRLNLNYIAIFILILLFVCNGCEKKELYNSIEENNQQERQKAIKEESETLAEGYRSLYEEAVKENTLETLELQQKIIEYFGNIGYAAVDLDNQVDMVNYQQVEEFCGKAEQKKSGEITIFSVMNGGNFVRYDMQTDQGKVDVIVSSLKWKNGSPNSDYYHEFEAYTWKYTGKGYFFIEEYHPSGFDGAPGQTGFRVKPLDQACRELNRKYVLPMGYELNNLLIVDWNEQDFTNLEFYDLYERMYRLKYGTDVPYESEFGEDEYEVPKDEFEQVIQTYFQISSENIEKNAVYYPERKTYRYRPRGMYDYEFPYEPYPEVVSYEQQEDGTIKLLVEAVWVRKELDHAICSELVVRPLKNGQFQYVSNRVINSDENASLKWYMPRLSDEEWEQCYKEAEKQGDQNERTTDEFFFKVKNEDNEAEIYENGYNLPIEESVREEAAEDCKEVMEQIRDIYMDADKGNALNSVIEEKVMVQMKTVIQANGYPVIGSEPYSAMENYQKMEKFLSDAECGKDGEVILYEIYWDGGIGRLKYSYDGTNMYLLSVRATWNDENKPVISYVSYTRIKEWKYTEKGWFGYKLCVPEPPEVSEIVDGSCLVRVTPLSNECRELSKQCAFPLGYQGNNILCSNWDSSHMDKLDYNGMYEYLYAMKYQKKFDSDNYPNGIPKEEFESLIMEYFPITAEKIQEYSVFDEENQTYAWVRLGCLNYTPAFFGTSLPEVTDVKENGDGTVTLTVEAVCDMVVCDDAVITHELVMRFADDGSFQYLGNKILGDGIKDIPDYQYRIVNQGKENSRTVVAVQ